MVYSSFNGRLWIGEEFEELSQTIFPKTSSATKKHPKSLEKDILLCAFPNHPKGCQTFTWNFAVFLNGSGLYLALACEYWEISGFLIALEFILPSCKGFDRQV